MRSESEEAQVAKQSPAKEEGDQKWGEEDSEDDKQEAAPEDEVDGLDNDQQWAAQEEAEGNAPAADSNAEVKPNGSGITKEYQKPYRGFKKDGNWRGNKRGGQRGERGGYRGHRGERGGYRGGYRGDGERPQRDGEERVHRGEGGERPYYKKPYRPYRHEQEEVEAPEDDSWNVIKKKPYVKPARQQNRRPAVQ